MFRNRAALPASLTSSLIVLGLIGLNWAIWATIYLESRASAGEETQAQVHPAYTTKEVTGLRELAKTFLEKRASFEFRSLEFWLSLETMARPEKDRYDATLDRWLEANRLRVAPLAELRGQAWPDAVQAGVKEYVKWSYLACLVVPTLSSRAALTKIIEVYVNTVTGLVLATAPERIPPASSS